MRLNNLIPAVAVGCLSIGIAFAQSPGNVQLYGPTATPGAPRIDPNALAYSINLGLKSKADVANGVLSNPTVTGGSFTGSTFVGATFPGTNLVSPTINGGTITGATITGGNLGQPNGPAQLDGSGRISTTQSIFAQAPALALFNNNTPTTLSGSSLQQWLYYNSQLSGTYNGQLSANLLANTTDTANLAASQGGYPTLEVLRTFGGAGTKGPRTGIFSNLTAAVAITGDTSPQQYNSLIGWFTGNVNVGGTGTTSATSKGDGYGIYPQSILTNGATNWNRVSVGEGDIGINASSQTMALTGTIAAGDVITVTFTSASLNGGSPVAVTYTVGSGNTADMVGNGLQAAITANATLLAADVSGVSHLNGSTTTDTFYWPAGITDMAITAVTTGAETLALGASTLGASSYSRLGWTIENLRQSKGVGGSTNPVEDSAINIGSASQGGMSGLWGTGINIQGIAPTGTIISSQQLQSAFGDSPAAPSRVGFGVDFSKVNFTLASGQSLAMPGFSVDGAGNVSVGNGLLSSGATGLTISVPGVRGSGNAAIANGGGGGTGNVLGNYFVGDVVFDPYGGQHQVTAVNNQTGVVTGIITLVEPSFNGSAPSNPVATTAGSGIGLTLTLTWAAANSLILNPGAPTTAGALTASSLAITGSVPQATVLAGPISGTGAPTQRGLTTGDITGLASMAVQSSSNVAITGGAISVPSLRVPPVTVATLTTCNSAAEGKMAGVTDATAPAFLVALTGGGSVHAPAYCNGTTWISP